MVLKLAAFLCVFVALVVADDNGMVMSMDGPMALASGQMLPYLHFATGDIIWFQGWVPESRGAMAGACIGLFLLAVVDRWLSAIRGVAQAHWRNRALVAYSNKVISLAAKGDQTPSPHPAPPRSRIPRTFSAFNWSHDLPRGILFAAQAALSFAFMLVIMSFQASFIIAIVVGLGVGEAMFGRYLDAVSTH